MITFALFMALAGTVAARGKPQWLKVETPGFTIYSDAPEKQAAACAVDYAAFRRVLGELFVQPGHELPPSVLILFRSSSSFRDLLGNRPEERGLTRVNFETEIDGTPYSTFAIAGDRHQALELTFEFETIWALRRIGYYVPVWMSQGAGEVLSELRLRKGKCLIGTADHHSSRSEFNWPHFFELGETSSVYNDPSQLGDYLSQAWGLMHWILFNDADTRTRFAALAARLRNTNAIDAVAAVMATPPDQFNRAINRHFARFRNGREIDFDEAAVRAQLHFTPAPEAEILAQTSNILAASNQVYRCNTRLDRARELDPDLPSVRNAWARRMLREGRQQEAIESYRAAIAAGTKNFNAYIISAMSRLDDVSSGGSDVAGEGGLPANTAADELRQAIKLNPGSTLAYRELGRAFFVMPKVTEANAAELTSGLVPGAEGEIVRFYRALVYARLGHADECRADLQAVVNDPVTDEHIRQAAAARLGRM
ncbi:MAG TPA: hypothetical protein VG710_14235 [Opitutus sp.]|nr:hypothetical protein [Opitutus sp.]